MPGVKGSTVITLVVTYKNILSHEVNQGVSIARFEKFEKRSDFNNKNNERKHPGRDSSRLDQNMALKQPYNQ